MNHAFASDKTLKEGCEACLWPHTDGQGLHLILDVVPLDSRVTMRVPSENDEVPIGQHNLFSYRFSDRVVSLNLRDEQSQSQGTSVACQRVYLEQ